MKLTCYNIAMKFDTSRGTEEPQIWIASLQHGRCKRNQTLLLQAKALPKRLPIITR